MRDGKLFKRWEEAGGGRVGGLLLERVAYFLQQHFGAREGWGVGRRWRGSALDLVDNLYQRKNTRGNDEKLNDLIDEDAVGDDWGPGILRLCKRLVGFSIDRKEKIVEVHAFQNGSDWRHDNIRNQAVDDFSETSADDNTDCEVDDISSGDEFAEFLGNLHSVGQASRRSRAGFSRHSFTRTRNVTASLPSTTRWS